VDIGWNTSKIISWLISLKSSLTAGPKIDLFHREHPQILAGIGVRYGKSGSRRTKSGNISETAEDRAKVTINCLCEVMHDL